MLIITLIFLAPIYWIASTAFKPRNSGDDGAADGRLPAGNLAVREAVHQALAAAHGSRRPEEYAAAPWWERMVFDGGEKVMRDGKGQVQFSAYPDRFINSLIVAIISTVLAVGMGTLTAYGFSRFKVKGEADLLFFILSTRMLPPVVVAIPMFLMYRAVGLNDTHSGLIILYTAFNLSLLGVADEGLHGRDPEGVRGGGARRRLHAHAGLLQDRAAGGRDRHRRDRRVLLHHGVERICLRADHDQPRARRRRRPSSLARSARACRTGR